VGTQGNGQTTKSFSRELVQARVCGDLQLPGLVLHATATIIPPLTKTDCPKPWPAARRETTPVSGNTGSEGAVAWARRELDECLSQHSACAHSNCNPLPTRVLQIFGPESVKLHLTANEALPYICLSHCWGTLPMIRTTSLTLEKFQQQIAWEELPKTFQDAISFALRLGYQYVWIDSLCIVQDSAEDWRHEGSKMADIYRNASLTLAATSSSDSRGGCFVKTRDRHLSRKWSFTDAENNAYEIHTRIHLDHIRFMQWSLPLSIRAWAFQERLLSPRVLHFAENELIWECSEQIHCECETIYHREWSITNKTALRPDLWAEESLQNVDRQWQEIVSLYTAKDLTFDKDIFPALQGLAKMVPHRMGAYLAGLWRDTLASNITWYAPRASSVTRLEEWRAPSWSWASNSKPIKWTNMGWHHLSSNEITRATYITVLDAQVSAIGDDTTGEIISGELLIRGRGLPGKLQASDRQKGIASLKLQSPDGLYAVPERGEISRRDPLTFDQTSNALIFWDYNIMAAGKDYVHSGTDIIAVRTERFKDKTGIRMTTAWILLKHCSQELDVFERIGLLHVHDIDVTGQSIPMLDQAIKNSLLRDYKIV
jgi:hypothetical protein